MDPFEDPGGSDGDVCNGEKYVGPGKTDTQVQLTISLLLGVSAFLTFCFLRPRWKSLYAARKRHLDPSIGLPTLPDTFFGWMPVLYRVTDQQVLESAGLDAFVFLAFFKMSIKLFAVIFFFSVVVLYPINRHFRPSEGTGKGASSVLFPQFTPYSIDGDGYKDMVEEPDSSFNPAMGYLWSYLVFTYFFSGLAVYFMNKETFRIIRIRQDYLGTQSTVTDRTFRLSGIPKDLRTERDIKELVEKLEIGKVESVTLCRDWKELDDLVDERKNILLKLEEAWSVYVGQKPLQSDRPPPSRNADGAVDTDVNGGNGGPRDDVDEEAGESDQLLRGAATPPYVQRERPQTRLWYGFLGLQSRKTDAIDYFSEKLRLLDEKIVAARKKKYEATGLAFVTMDSIAACQMAIQALIDPHPGRLLTKPAPAPSDVVWRNAYAPRFKRRLRSWVITVFVGILSVVWLVPVGFLAGLASYCTVKTLLPSFADWLEDHEIARSLVQTGLPTAAVSLLNVAVPFLYDYLSYKQGMLSQGDIALSAVSKNFFFAFFNIFLIYTVFGAVGSIADVLRRSLSDATYIALTLAEQIENLGNFYTNFVMLQGLGLFPFRLLEFGSVSLYPIQRLGAKTPRDFAEMVQPPMFYYGFYLPTALLVFILSLVYSTILGGFKVVGLGLAYFILGYFTYKYQLLYAMDQPHHATGGAWRIICYRIMLGLMVFQLTLSGYLALKKAFTVALLIIPLLIATMWYSYWFRRRFEPLTRFISLRSVKRGEDPRGDAILDDDFEGEGGREEREFLRRGSTVDEDREKGLKFVNPSLVVPLERPWIYKDPPPPLTESELGEGLEFDAPHSNLPEYDQGPVETEILPPDPSFGDRPSIGRRAAGASSNSSSSVSLGDTHIWRDA